MSAAKPATRYAGSGLAVFGAMAPFEKVVVVRSVGWRSAGAIAGADVITVSLALATCVLETPAAESTQAFISESVMRATLSARALATATVALAESTVAFRGGATKVVNCAESAAGIKSVAAHKVMAVVAERSVTGILLILPPFEA